MIEQIRLLVELQRLDSSIIEKGARLKAIPLKLSALEKPLKEVQSTFDAQKQKHQAADKKKRDKERELDEINDRLSKLKTRTSGIKDNKAYQAHLKEIEATEKTRYGIEDEILALMEAIDLEAGALKGADALIEAEKQKAAALKKEIAAEISIIEKELDGLKAQRKGFSASIEADLYGQYMSLLKTKRGLAVVEVRGEVCQGCNMNIMPQLFVELKRNERIIDCPQCGRILYCSESTEQPEAPRTA